MEDQNNIIINKDNNQDDEIKIIEIVENKIVIDEKPPEKDLDKNDLNNKEIDIVKIEEHPDNRKNNDKNNNEKNKEDDIIIINEVIDVNKQNENNNKDEKEKKTEIIVQKDNKEGKELNEKLEMILKEVKKQDIINKLLQKKIDDLKKKNETLSSNFNSQIKELKESQEKELNQIKQNYENKINDMKKVFATKEDIKYFAKKHEIDYVKEELDDLNSKFNNLDREYNSKMGFMESNMERIFKIEEENKNQEGNKILIEQNELNKDNNELNNNKETNNNNVINKNIIPDYFDEKKLEAMKKEPKKNYDMSIYKDLNNVLKVIFSEKNLKTKEIDKKSLESLKKIGIKLLKEKKFPLNFISDFIKETKQNLAKDNFNLEQKKCEIYKMFDEINDEIFPKLNNAEKEKDKKKVDIKKFNIEAFRKEYNLSKEEFSDEVLKDAYIKSGGDLVKTFSKIIIK